MAHIMTNERMHKIICEAISKVVGDVTTNGIRLLKHVKAKDERHLRPADYDIRASIENDGCVKVEWKRDGSPRSMTVSDWLKPVKGSDTHYTSMSNWDDLDWVLQCLGVKKVKKSTQKVDDFGDVKTFVTSYYDLSSIL